MAYPSNQPDADVQFLIDECLTPQLVRKAIEFGYFGEHVAALGLSGTADDLLCERAVAYGKILVTNNGRDFRRIYRRFRNPPGLVVLLPSVGWRQQVALFEAVLRFIEKEPVIIDRLVQIGRDGAITVQSWSVDASQP